MINITTFTLERDNGSKETITIDPVLIGLPESKNFTGVYRLLETDLTGQELGEVAFHLDDASRWEFTGEYFSIIEQEYIVDFIKAREPLDSFTFTEIENGVETNYRITDNEGHFGIEKNGIVIAVIEHSEDWEQIEGTTLDKNLFEKLISKIEHHND